MDLSKLTGLKLSEYYQKKFSPGNIAVMLRDKADVDPAPGFKFEGDLSREEVRFILEKTGLFRIDTSYYPPDPESGLYGSSIKKYILSTGKFDLVKPEPNELPTQYSRKYFLLTINEKN